MSAYRDEAEALLAARLGDALNKSRRGEIAMLSYLTPREQKRAARILSACGEQGSAWCWGGYPDSERACLFVLPDYLTAILEAMTDASPNDVTELLGEDVTDAVCAVEIRGSGYRVLTHRDYLGSILALGIERDSFGDIALQDEHRAVVFCTAKMASFLCENLERVASDAVKCRPCVLDDTFTDGRRYAAVNDTVASARLDCVVAALTNLSREAAQHAVKSGLVEVDFEAEERTDFQLTAPATISIRGYGRFILRSFDGETRKGRLRMRADRLV